MSISPATDIVLDVARAADPTRYKRAVARLDATAAAGFAESLAAEEIAPARAVDATTATQAPLDIVPVRTAEDTVPGAIAQTVAQPATAKPMPKAGDAKGDKAAATYRQFEAMALATMLEAAMPSDGSFFGKGVAGDTWKSMMIDQIAGEMAKHGGIGIAGELARFETGSRPKATPVTAKVNHVG